MAAGVVPVRLMVPFSMQCSHCQQYIYKNTKYNARKTSTEETYLGLRVFQFSFRCSSCSGEILIRTDPKGGDYRMVAGAARLDGAARRPGAPNLERAPDKGAPVSFASESSAPSDSPRSPHSSPARPARPAVGSLPTARRGTQRGGGTQSVGGIQKLRLPTPKRRKHLTGT